MSRFLILFVLISTQAFGSSEYIDERTGVTIYFDVDSSTFPEFWHTNEISAMGVSLDTSMRQRSLETILTALGKYPRSMIKENLKSIYILKYMEFYGVEYGGTNAYDAVYVTNPYWEEGYTDIWLQQLFHHEFSSILLYNYPNRMRERTWIGWNKGPYGDGGVEALKSESDAMDFDPYYNALGFLCEYGMSDYENDFNCFAENIFVPTKYFYETVFLYPSLTKKLELIVQFYYRNDRRLNKVYFIKLYKEAIGDEEDW